MLCGRGSGKSMTLAVLMLRSIKDGDDHIHASSTHSQASEAIDQLRELLAAIDMNLSRKLQGGIYAYVCPQLGNGRIRCFSAKNDKMRSKNSNILSIDEAAFVPADYFKKVAYPCLRKGSKSGRTQCYLVSSPLDSSNWLSIFVQSDKSEQDFLSKDDRELDYQDFLVVHSTYRDIKHLKKPNGDPAITEDWIKGIEMLYKDEDQLIIDREINGLIVSDISDGLFTNLLRNLVPNDKPITYNKIIMGVDIADEGDFTSAVARTDNNILLMDRKKTNPDNLRDFLKGFIARLGKKPDVINYDASGLGRYAKSAFDGLAVVVHPIKFGSSAIRKDLYENRRAELHDDFANILRNKVYVCPQAMPLAKELKDDLKYVRRIPDKIKMCLMPKEDIRKLIHRSPDIGDGTVLAFAKTNSQDYASLIKKAANAGRF